MVRQPQRPANASPTTVIILTGGTGRTAEGVIQAALAQFDNPEVRLVRRTHVRSVRSAEKVVREASQIGAVVCYTLVDPKVRSAVVKQCERQMVSGIDVLGQVLTVLTDRLGRRPKGRAGLSYELNKEQFDRIDAVDFTLAHDDGKRLHDLDHADVVLVGVSRVSKSVTCFYLAYRGVRAANVPLIAGCPLAAELVRLDARKVFGLTMNAQRLQAIRSIRLPRISTVPVKNYVDADKVADELRYARQVMSEHGWRCIDVSYTAVEDVAREITDFLRG